MAKVKMRIEIELPEKWAEQLLDIIEELDISVKEAIKRAIFHYIDTAGPLEICKKAEKEGTVVYDKETMLKRIKEMLKDRRLEERAKNWKQRFLNRLVKEGIWFEVSL